MVSLDSNGNKRTLHSVQNPTCWMLQVPAITSHCRTQVLSQHGSSSRDQPACAGDTAKLVECYY